MKTTTSANISLSKSGPEEIPFNKPSKLKRMEQFKDLLCVIPALKLNTRGLFDVTKFSFVPVDAGV